MKKYLLLIVLITTLFQVYSQDYDLIVTTDGDSVACRIDSITDTHIYFKMKSKEHWKHTHINREDVIEFKYNVINKRVVVFRQGTSIIEKLIPRPTSMFDIQKNSISLENTHTMLLIVSYERMFPLDNLLGITVRGGYGQGIAWFEDVYYWLGETTLLLGGPKHIIEPGFSVYFAGSFETTPMARIGYRLQGYNGVLIRAGLYLIYYRVMPTLSIGISF